MTFRCTRGRVGLFWFNIQGGERVWLGTYKSLHGVLLFLHLHEWI
jgi:hypothetical protein